MISWLTDGFQHGGGCAVASWGRGRPGSLLFLLGSAVGASQKAPPRDALGSWGCGDEVQVPGQAGRPGGKAAGGGGFGHVPKVRLVLPPVSPLPRPGSSPWWRHQEPVPALVVGGDVDVFSARLLGGETPSVDVVRTFLLLIRVGSFLLQLLPFVFRPPVLEPHFHLGERRDRRSRGSQHNWPQ